MYCNKFIESLNWLLRGRVRGRAVVVYGTNSSYNDASCCTTQHHCISYSIKFNFDFGRTAPPCLTFTDEPTNHNKWVSLSVADRRRLSHYTFSGAVMAWCGVSVWWERGCLALLSRVFLAESSLQIAVSPFPTPMLYKTENSRFRGIMNSIHSIPLLKLDSVCAYTVFYRNHFYKNHKAEICWLFSEIKKIHEPRVNKVWQMKLSCEES